METSQEENIECKFHSSYRVYMNVEPFYFLHVANYLMEELKLFATLLTGKMDIMQMFHTNKE